MEKLDIYTGTLTYQSIEFSFVFDNTELRLIASADKKTDICLVQKGG